MSCNHIDVTAETNQYHEGSLICVCCDLVVLPGQLVSESSSPSLEPVRTPPELADHLYDRSKFFIRWVRKHNQEKFGLENGEVIRVTQIYREFCNFYFGWLVGSPYHGRCTWYGIARSRSMSDQDLLDPRRLRHVVGNFSQ
jgi:hypothetical protein